MSGFIFTNRYGLVHNPQTINLAIKRIVDEYNSCELLKASKSSRSPKLLPRFSCHCLRHSFCTRLIETVDDIKVIQALMGHEDIETTMDIYTEVTDEKKKETMERLGKNMKIY